MDAISLRWAAMPHFDNDLKHLVEVNKVTVEAAIQLQILRILRGKQLQVVETPIEGWSADGKTWLPHQPGDVK
jgi:hypothetical protein